MVRSEFINYDWVNLNTVINNSDINYINFISLL